MTDRRVAVPAGVVALLGAGAAIFFAVGLRVVDCGNEAGSTCSTGGLLQFVGAGLGVLPVLCTLVLAVAGRGRPLRWLLLAGCVYAAWAAYVTLSFEP